MRPPDEAAELRDEAAQLQGDIRKLRDKMTMITVQEGPSLPVYFGILAAVGCAAFVVSGLIVGWPW